MREYCWWLLSWGLVLMAPAWVVQAQDKPFETFGDYRVYYSVFNSSFIQPDIAERYNLSRGKEQVLVNVSLVKVGSGGDSKAMAAEVSGSAANLMQQQKKLQFVPIREQGAVYYLASLRISNEEVLHFNIAVKAPDQGQPFTLKFRKTLYVER